MTDVPVNRLEIERQTSSPVLDGTAVAFATDRRATLPAQNRPRRLDRVPPPERFVESGHLGNEGSRKNDPPLNSAVDRGGECAAACSAVKATRCAGAAKKFAATLMASARYRNSAPVIDGALRGSKLPREAPTPASPFGRWGSLESHPLGAAVARSSKLASDGGGEGMAAIPLVSPSIPTALPCRDCATELRRRLCESDSSIQGKRPDPIVAVHSATQLCPPSGRAMFDRPPPRGAGVEFCDPQIRSL
jgi:hypothetical protein